MPNALWAFIRSFGYAFEGLWTLVRTQRNAQVHLLAVMVVIGAGLWLHVTVTEWLAVIVMCSVVLSAEAANTAIEAVVDLVSPQYHPLAKRAKDVAASAVLIAALGALILAAVIVGSHL